MQNKIISITGMAGSGKSEAVKIFEERGFKRVYFGGLVLAEVQKRGLKLIESDEKKVREDLRKKHGMSAIAVLAIPQIKEYLSKGFNVVIDGVYSWSELKTLKKEFASNYLNFAIHSSISLRAKRLSNRKIRPYTLDSLKSRDYGEIQNLEKGGPIAYADFHYVNDKDLISLKAYIEDIVLKNLLI